MFWKIILALAVLILPALIWSRICGLLIRSGERGVMEADDTLSRIEPRQLVFKRWHIRNLAIQVSVFLPVVRDAAVVLISQHRRLMGKGLRQFPPLGDGAPLPQYVKPDI